MRPPLQKPFAGVPHRVPAEQPDAITPLLAINTRSLTFLSRLHGIPAPDADEPPSVCCRRQIAAAGGRWMVATSRHAPGAQEACE
jgi:hypothetical protein